MLALSHEIRVQKFILLLQTLRAQTENNAHKVLQDISSLVSKNGASEKTQQKVLEKQASLNRLVSQIEQEVAEVKNDADFWTDYEAAKDEFEQVLQLSEQIENLMKRDVSTENNLNKAIEDCKVG